tara:strand:+ start:401 stop:862 length:462 start_codon:yes stop_codon:yes gene_type:complete
MRKRIYTDTSVIGGCLDSEFESGSSALLATFNEGSNILVVSDLTLVELENAPPSVREILQNVPVEYVEFVEFSEEASRLADSYMAEGVITRKSRVDAQHIAIATMNHVDVLVSWNFKHIVNLDRIHGYNSVNLKLGYPMIEIRTPTEVLNYEN